MSIAGRLYNIIRSRLGQAAIKMPKHRTTYRAETSWQTGETAAAQPNQDPELAQYYANLEVPYGAGPEAVKAAWKRLLKRYHPDLHSNDAEKRATAEALTRGLNHAYRELEKHLKRR